MERYIMRFLKKFENNESTLYKEYVKEKWTPFTKEMFRKYCDIINSNEKFIHQGKTAITYLDINFIINDFFNELDDEYIDVNSYDLYMVYEDHSETVREHGGESESVFAICEANGKYHAILKTSLYYKDPEMVEFLIARNISENDIERELKRIEVEKDIWSNII